MSIVTSQGASGFLEMSLIKYASPFDISFNTNEKFASITCSVWDFEGCKNTLRY